VLAIHIFFSGDTSICVDHTDVCVLACFGNTDICDGTTDVCAGDTDPEHNVFPLIFMFMICWGCVGDG